MTEENIYFPKENMTSKKICFTAARMTVSTKKK